MALINPMNRNGLWGNRGNAGPPRVIVGGKAVDQSGAGRDGARVLIGGKAVATFNPIRLPEKDSVDLSAGARGLSATYGPFVSPSGNVADDRRFVVPTRNGDIDAARKGKMGTADRLLGLAAGASYSNYQNAIAPTRGRENDGTTEDLAPLFQEDLIYQSLRAKAKDERESIQKDMKSLLKRNGIAVRDTSAFDFKISMDGEVRVTSAKGNLDASAIEDVLNSDKKLGLRMVKNSAMLKLQDHRYDDTQTSRAEMALVNVTLQEELGYGLRRLAEVGIENIWGHDTRLDAMMAGDALLEEQVFTYMGSAATFEATWSFGNDHVADKTNSARSFLPTQGVGTFAEEMFMNAETADSEVSFTMTPDGMFEVVDAASNLRDLTPDEKQMRMDTMTELLHAASENGGLEKMKEASQRAIEEHLVQHGGDKENLEVTITARAGQWSIDVKEKGMSIRVPLGEDGDGVIL